MAVERESPDGFQVLATASSSFLRAETLSKGGHLVDVTAAGFVPAAPQCLNAPMRIRSLLILALLLAACAAPQAAATPTPSPSPTPTPTPSPSPSPTPSPAPTDPPAESYFKPVTGYDYVLPPAEVTAAMKTAFDKPEITNISSGYAIRFITKGGDATGMFVLSLALLPSYAAAPGILDGVASGYSGTKAREMTLSGRRALFFPLATPKTMIWSHRTFIVFLYGSDEAAMTTYATALITANQ
jgi:hypothetical protein